MDLVYLLLILAFVSMGNGRHLSEAQQQAENEDANFQFHFCEMIPRERCFNGYGPQEACNNVSLQIDLKENTTVRLATSEGTLLSVPIKNISYLHQYANKIYDKRSVPQMLFLKTIYKDSSTVSLVIGDRIILRKTSPLESAKADKPGFELKCGRLTDISVNVPNDADVNRLYDDHPALFWALIFGDLKAVKTLINNVPDIHKECPFPIVHAASRSCNEDVLRFLLEHGEIVKVHNYLGDPLVMAVEEGCVNVARVLLKNRTVGATVSWFNSRNSLDALHIASTRHDDPDLVDLLISHGADLTNKDSLGRNSLHLAAISGRQKVVKKLVERGVNVDVKDGQGSTPLMLAAEAGNDEIVEELIVLGANVNAVDSKLRSVMKYSTRFPAISNTLKSKGAN